MESRKYLYSLRLIIHPGVLQQQTYLVTNQLANILTDKLTPWISAFLEKLITYQPLQKCSALSNVPFNYVVIKDINTVSRKRF